MDNAKVIKSTRQELTPSTLMRQEQEYSQP
jgi:hypothetical protein